MWKDRELDRDEVNKDILKTLTRSEYSEMSNSDKLTVICSESEASPPILSYTHFNYRNRAPTMEQNGTRMGRYRRAVRRRRGKQCERGLCITGHDTVSIFSIYIQGSDARSGSLRRPHAKEIGAKFRISDIADNEDHGNRWKRLLSGPNHADGLRDVDFSCMCSKR